MIGGCKLMAFVCKQLAGEKRGWQMGLNGRQMGVNGLQVCVNWWQVG